MPQIPLERHDVEVPPSSLPCARGLLLRYCNGGRQTLLCHPPVTGACLHRLWQSLFSDALRERRRCVAWRALHFTHLLTARPALSTRSLPCILKEKRVRWPDCSHRFISRLPCRKRLLRQCDVADISGGDWWVRFRHDGEEEGVCNGRRGQKRDGEGKVQGAGKWSLIALTLHSIGGMQIELS